jgi:hypothetical protein
LNWATQKGEYLKKQKNHKVMNLLLCGFFVENKQNKNFLYNKKYLLKRIALALIEAVSFLSRFLRDKKIQADSRK